MTVRRTNPPAQRWRTYPLNCRLLRRGVLAVLIFMLLTALLPSGALAASPAETEAPDTFDPADWPEDDERFAGKNWDEVVSDFLRAHALDGSKVGLVYYNTVTGEQHDWNGGQYFTAGSTYKVPINLVYADRVSSGEMTLDDPVGG